MALLRGDWLGPPGPLMACCAATVLKLEAAACDLSGPHSVLSAKKSKVPTGSEVVPGGIVIGVRGVNWTEGH